MPRPHLIALVGLAGLLWGGALLAGGATVPIGFLRPFSFVVGGASLAVAAFDRWLWRLPLFSGWFVDRPDLQGTWRGTLRSNWVHPDTGERVGERPIYLVVRQTFSSLSVRLMTGESSSDSLAASLVKLPSGVDVLYCIYESIPDLWVRDRSPIHFGGMRLQVHDGDTRLDGHYWTDRNSVGDLEVARVSRAGATDFHAASELRSGADRLRRGVP